MDAAHCTTFLGAVLILLAVWVGQPSFAQSAYTLPENRKTITAENANKITELATINVGGRPASIALSPDAKLFAYGSYSNNHIHLVDLSKGEEIATLKGHTSGVTGLAFSPDGQILASTGAYLSSSGKTDTSVRLWDIKTRKELVVYKTPGIDEFAVSPDGRLLVSAGARGRGGGIVWDIDALAEKMALSDVQGAVAFSPDGSLLLYGGPSQDNSVYIWDFKAGKQTMAFKGHKRPVNTVTFSPNGNLLASGSDDTTIKLWSVENGKELKVLEGKEGYIVRLAFSPDGSVLASLSGRFAPVGTGGLKETPIRVRFWNAESGTELKALALKGRWSALSFDTAWTPVVTTEDTGIIRLWGVL